MIRWAFVLPLLLFACTSGEPSPLPQSSRIVSLAPVTTEFLFALGLDKNVVGVTTYCDRPDGAKRVTKIGGFADPQLEAIIKLSPTLVVATPFGQAKSVVDSLKVRGITTLAQPVDTLEQMREFLVVIGEATGRSAQAKQLQADLDRRFSTFRNRFETSPKVLFLISSSPLIAAAPTTFPGQILTHIGARNIVSASTPLWPLLSLERLIQNPPDIVVVSSGQSALEATKNDLKHLITKHANIRFFASKGVLLQRPGPYLNDEIEELVEGISLSLPRPATAGRGSG